MDFKYLWSQINIFLDKNVTLDRRIIDKILENKGSQFDKAKLLFENIKEIGGEEFQIKLKEIKEKIDGQTKGANKHQQFMMNVFDIEGELNSFNEMEFFDQQKQRALVQRYLMETNDEQIAKLEELFIR